MSDYFSADFAKIFVPLIGAVIAWFVNRRRDRQLDDYRRKEERYRELLLAVRGFHDPSAPAELRQRFFDQMYLSWLYCPDEVIRKGIRFIETVADGNTSSDDDRRDSLGSFVLAIRADLLSRGVVKSTSLVPRDFRPLNSGAPRPPLSAPRSA